MKHFKIILLLLGLVLTNTLWAENAPAVCPGVEAIKYRAFPDVLVVEDEKSKMYVVSQFNKYDTTSRWVFFIGVPFTQATSGGDALNKAIAVLKTLSGNPSPTLDSKSKNWYCEYQNDYHYPSVALIYPEKKAVALAIINSSSNIISTTK